MKLHYGRALWIGLAWLFWGLIGVQANENTELLKKIQSRYQSIQSFQGKFLQQNYTNESPIPREAKGQISYLRPGKMRWDYDKPHQQLLVTDGQMLWLYDPQLENVTKQKLEKVTQDTPLAFLLGVGDLQRDFTPRPVTQKLTTQAEAKIIELQPKKSIAALEFIQLAVNPTTYDLLQIVLQDTQGNYRRLEFQEMQYNLSLDSKLFIFEVTQEMDVINADEATP